MTYKDIGVSNDGKVSIPLSYKNYHLLEIYADSINVSVDDLVAKITEDFLANVEV